MSVDSDPLPSTAKSAVHPHPGLFLTLDGPDGAGKSTQASKLAAWLRDQGFDVVSCRDPGSTELGDRLRRIVLDRDHVPISMVAEMLVYMTSRAQLVDEVIRPALAAGRVVVSDRFLLSNLVYQGLAGGLDRDDVWRVGRVATSGLLPDLTLILDVPFEVSRNRLGQGRDRIESRPEDYHRQVRNGFLEAARLSQGGSVCPFYPAPVLVVDATADPDTVTNRIRAEVERVLAINPRS
jgi:dTMP kinase